MSAARPDTWMPLYVADYLADTGHLSTRQHGAYLLLIMHYWRTGKALPTRVEHLFRICRLTKDEWAEDGEAVMEFFDVTADGYVHSRIEEELQSAQAFIEKKAAAGRASATARAQQKPNTPSTPVQTHVATDDPTNRQLEAKTLPSPSPIAAAAAPARDVPREISPSGKLIAAFDIAVGNIWGKELSRPWPHPKDCVTADRWLANGYEPDFCEQVIVAKLRDMHGKKQTPPKTLSYFDQPLADARAQASKPMPEGNADDDLVATLPAHLNRQRPATSFDRAVDAARGLVARG